MPVIVQLQASKPAYARAEGERWLTALEPELSKLTKGTVIVINVATGEYETGQNQHEALRAYHARFGFNQTIGWVHEIGREIFIGGGVA